MVYKRRSLPRARHIIKKRKHTTLRRRGRRLQQDPRQMAEAIARGYITAGTAMAGKYAYNYAVSKVGPRGSPAKTSDKIQEDMGSGGDVTRSSVKFALSRRKSKAQKINKIVRSSEQKITNVFRGISPFLNTTNGPLNAQTSEVGGGAYWLHNYTSNAVTVMPLHLYDLTSTNNVIGGSVAVYNPAFGLNSSNNNYNFYNLFCQNSNGATISTGWVPENVPGATTSGVNYPNKRGFIESVNVKMYCYGATSNATQWDVNLVQLKEDTMHPDELKSGVITLSGREQNQKDGFWQYMSSRQVSHPIDNLDSMNRRYYKVLKSFNFVLQPRLTNEVETLPHQKELSIWIPMNRICRYDWTDTTKVASVAPGQFQSSVGLVSNIVAPRARIYLIVRATNTTNVTSPAVPTINSTPSYDLVIRQKQIIVE